MRFARGDDEIIRLLLLEHEPHGPDVVAGVAPVALGLEVAQPQLLLETALDPGSGIRDFAGDELATAPRPFVVEEDAATAEHLVALAVVHRDPVAVDLGHAVGA